MVYEMVGSRVTMVFGSAGGNGTSGAAQAPSPINIPISIPIKACRFRSGSKPLMRFSTVMVDKLIKVNFDELVKSLKTGHSRESGSPELLDLPGFPLSRE
jgi:hypothetical protein